ncbi:MAG: 4-hydroxy-tetrahydrodipicolinate reductase [Proteobacteria bacterium]|nr:4-hydroxy-tetrahydrodipicolinate reductase [Pseudomonadota bacterium]
MGRALIQAINAAEDCQLVSLWVRDEEQCSDLRQSSDLLLSDDINRVVGAADVLIDFSLPEATDTVLQAIVAQGTPLVCGVSGLSAEQQLRLDSASAIVPVVYDRNMSIGIAVLESLVGQAAALLGFDFEAEVHEIHHVHKIDAPSGTALKLGEAIAAARRQNFADVSWYEPDAKSREPAAGDIRFEVERRGEVPGDHSVILSSSAESLTFRHSVTSRQVFADGALRAARWVVRQSPGRYRMREVLLDKP